MDGYMYDALLTLPGTSGRCSPGRLYLIIAAAAASDQGEEDDGGNTNNHHIKTCQIAVEHYGHLTCFPFTLFYDRAGTAVTAAVILRKVDRRNFLKKPYVIHGVL
jgi:hypothetical protein